MAERKRIVVDARMVCHSGIGTSIRGLLEGWKQAPPPFQFAVAGSERALREAQIEGVEILKWNAPVYGPRALLSPPSLRDTDLFLAMHYSAPVAHRVPMIAVVHDVIHATHPTRATSRPYCRVVLPFLRRKCRFVITPSRHTKVQLQTLFGFPAHRVLRIPWGPGITTLSKAEEIRPNLLPEEPFFLAVGINKAHKNWEFLFRHLADRWTNDDAFPSLAVAGFGPLEQLERIPQRWHRRGRIHFLPPLSDGELISVYRGSVGLIFPSLVEGFGFPVAEAQALGVPVALADLPPMNELAVPTTALFDPDSPLSFHRALDHLLGMPRPEPQRQLSWKRTAKRFTEAIERSLA